MQNVCGKFGSVRELTNVLRTSRSGKRDLVNGPLWREVSSMSRARAKIDATIRPKRSGAVFRVLQVRALS